MLFTIKQVIFTGYRKDWTKLLINDVPYYALHLEVTDELWKNRWISRFYDTEDKKDFIIKSILIWKEYEITFKQNWIYFNMINLKDKEWNIII